MTKEALFGTSIAGEARYDGSDAVVNLTSTNPSWTSAADAAAWKALLAKPKEGARYVVGAILRVTGTAINVSLAGGAPSEESDGLTWPLNYERVFVHAPDAIRVANFYLPTGASLHVELHWGRIA